MRILGWILFIVVFYGFLNLGLWWEARVSLIDGEVFLNIVKLIFTLVFALIGLYSAGTSIKQRYEAIKKISYHL